MKNITIIIALLFSLVSNGQTSGVKDIAFQIIEILEGTESIQEYSKNRKVVLNQLQDIRNWTEEGKISHETYLQLQTAYEGYSETMNILVDDLNSDLLRLYDNRKLKKSRAKKLLSSMSSQYSLEVGMANEIYLTEWTPAMENAMLESGSKGGIIVSIVAIFKIGETIFHALKDLFSTGKLNKEAEEQLMMAALKLAKKQLQSKLSLPQWKNTIPRYSASNESVEVPQSRSQGEQSGFNNEFSSNRNLETPNNDKYHISIAEFGSDRTIKLRASSKKITIGTSENSEDLSIYSTARPLQNGDRFWVKLNGNLKVNFFYFDKSERTWQDPYGKGIVVGSEENDEYKYLPARNQFFEIVGNSDSEEFLIILSNYSLTQEERQRVMREGKIRDELISSISSLLPNSRIQSPRLDNVGGGDHAAHSVSAGPLFNENTVIPVYIIIEKTNLKQ